MIKEMLSLFARMPYQGSIMSTRTCYATVAVVSEILRVARTCQKFEISQKLPLLWQEYKD